jgi:hypothetical protein
LPIVRALAGDSTITSLPRPAEGFAAAALVVRAAVLVVRFRVVVFSVVAMCAFELQVMEMGTPVPIQQCCEVHRQQSGPER